MKTKEEILDAEFLLNYGKKSDKKSLRQVELTAMQTYTDQETEKLREENKKLHQINLGFQDLIKNILKTVKKEVPLTDKSVTNPNILE